MAKSEIIVPSSLVVFFLMNFQRSSNLSTFMLTTGGTTPGGKGRVGSWRHPGNWFDMIHLAG